MPLNIVSTVGAFLMGIGFIFQVWQIAYSIKNHKRDVNGDPWNGRTLEWSLPSPAPVYNFATLPKIQEVDSWWEEKERIKAGKPTPQAPLEPIHMPDNSAIPFIQSLFWFIAGFGFVFNWMFFAIPGLIGVAVTMIVRSFQKDEGYYIPVDEIKKTEASTRGAG